MNQAPSTEQDRCGHWMPLSGVSCARRVGHSGHHRATSDRYRAKAYREANYERTLRWSRAWKAANPEMVYAAHVRYVESGHSAEASARRRRRIADRRDEVLLTDMLDGREPLLKEMLGA